MVALVNEAILSSSGSPYGKRSENLAVRMLGKQRSQSICTYRIERIRGGQRRGRVWAPNYPPPRLPKTYAEAFHPTGNSMAYCLQHAHLMGAKEIYLMGFTLRPGSAYEFGRFNPVTKKPSFYEQSAIESVISFCQHFEKAFPGRARLVKGWEGPIYQAGVFQVVDLGRTESKTPPWTR